MSAMAPDVSGPVPQCSREGCPSYDGKRCELTGFQPRGACEPAIEKLAGDLQVRDAEVGIMTAQRDSDALMIHSLKALIRQAQWSGRGRDPAGWYCPWCLNEGTQGHADGCPAVDVLGIGRGSF